MKALLLVSCIALVVGCATAKNRIKVDLTIGEGTVVELPTGERIHFAEGSRLEVYCMERDSVVGGGETNSRIENLCGTLKRNTDGTGLTDNGRLAIENAVKAGMAAYTGGASTLLDRGD